MTNLIQNKIYEHYATIISDPELFKSNHKKTNAMVEKHGNYFFNRMHEIMQFRDLSYQQAIDDCWRFYEMEPKKCDTCKHDGN